MQQAPIPEDEAERQAAVDRMKLVGTPPEERFNELTDKAAQDLGAPISLISIVDRDREWFKAKVGVEEAEKPRATSFCGHTVVQGKLFVIEDTAKDERFRDNPQVTNPPHIRFYAGIALHDHKTHQPIGAFCIKDTKPRTLSLSELNTLMEYAHKAEVELNREVEHGAPSKEKDDVSTPSDSTGTVMWRILAGTSNFTRC